MARCSTNAQGEVVGISSQIYTRSGGYQRSVVCDSHRTGNPLCTADSGNRQGPACQAVSVQEVDQAFADSFRWIGRRCIGAARCRKNGPCRWASDWNQAMVRKVDANPLLVRAICRVLSARPCRGRR